MATFLHGIDVKIVPKENAELWKTTIHSGYWATESRSSPGYYRYWSCSFSSIKFQPIQQI